MTSHRIDLRGAAWVGPVLRGMAPWLLLMIAGVVVLGLLWLPLDRPAPILRWLGYLASYTAFVLPFILFAAGLAVGRILGHSRRAVRVAAIAGISVSILSYGLESWVAPSIHDRILVALGPEIGDQRRFGVRTPIGILRNIEFVRANPPPRYSLRVNAPREHPPNVLLWHIHGPLAHTVFGVVNVLLGLLTSALTVDLSNRARRTVRLAIGVGGGIVLLACMVAASPVEPFLRDGTMQSGIASAWAPLLVPLIEGLVILCLVKRRRHG